MTITHLLFLLPSLLTGFISSVSGMGGGAILLGILTAFFPIRTLVPIHGIVQLSANLSRSWILRKFIKKKMTLYFLLGAPIGAYLGTLLLKQDISEKTLKLLIAGLIIFVVFKPKKMPQFKLREWQFSILGLMASTLGILIGSVGPFLAPFFLRDDINKEELVATKSCFQMIVHLIKIPSFLALGFNYFTYGYETLFLVFGALIGNWIGIAVLKKINKTVFTYIFKISLLAAAARLVYSCF